MHEWVDGRGGKAADVTDGKPLASCVCDLGSQSQEAQIGFGVGGAISDRRRRRRRSDATSFGADPIWPKLVASDRWLGRLTEIRGAPAAAKAPAVVARPRSSLAEEGGGQRV